MINFRLISNLSAQSVEQSLLRSFTQRENAIIAIAVAALAFLVACIVTATCCWRSEAATNHGPTKGPDQSKREISDDSKAKNVKQPEQEAVEKSPEKDLETAEASPEEALKKDADDPSGDEPPKPTFSELATSSDLQADFVVQAVDEMLAEKKDLSQTELDHLLAVRAQELQKKDLMQMQEMLEREQEEIVHLQAEEQKLMDKLEARGADRANLNHEIDELKKQVGLKEKAILDAKRQISKLKKGNHKEVLEKVQYTQNSEVEELGEKHPAANFRGVLLHKITIDKYYELTTDDFIKQGVGPEENSIVISGNRHKLDFIERTPSGDQIFWINTYWKGDGNLPWFAILWVRPNAIYHKVAIANLVADRRMMKKDLDDLQQRLQTKLTHDLKGLEDEMARINDSLATVQAELKTKGGAFHANKKAT